MEQKEEKNNIIIMVNYNLKENKMDLNLNSLLNNKIIKIFNLLIANL